MGQSQVSGFYLNIEVLPGGSPGEAFLRYNLSMCE